MTRDQEIGINAIQFALHCLRAGANADEIIAAYLRNDSSKSLPRDEEFINAYIHRDYDGEEVKAEAAQAPGYVIGTEDAIQAAIERDKANGTDWEGVGVIDTRGKARQHDL